MNPFLLCALALPPSNFTRPPVVSHYAAKSEEQKLRDFIERNAPGAEVFIHPNPQRDRLKEYGWERVPFTWRGNDIWIKRKPASDDKKLGGSA